MLKIPLLLILNLIFFSVTSYAKDKKETAIFNKSLNPETYKVRYSYDSSFDKDRKLISQEPRCMKVFSWIRSSEYFTKKELEAYIGAEIYMENECYGVLLGNAVGEYGKPEAMEKAVELGVITEDIYLFFIHSLGYSEVMSKHYNSLRALRAENDADKVRKEQLKLLDQYIKDRNDLAQTKNFLVLAKRAGVSDKYQKKFSKLFDAILDDKKKQ